MTTSSLLPKDDRHLRIAVLGAGSLGSLYGGLLAHAGYTTALISTNKEHMEAVSEHGLILEPARSEAENTSAQQKSSTLLIKNLISISDASALLYNPYFTNTPDLLLVCVKSGDTAKAIAEASCLVGKDTIVLTLQNGLGNVEAMVPFVPEGSIMVGVSYCGANLYAPGKVREGGRGKTLLGELNGKITKRLLLVQQTFAEAGLSTEVSKNVQGVLWTKLIVNAGINAIAALRGVRNGELLTDPEALNLMQRATAEALTVAKAKNISLIVADIEGYVLDIARATSQNYASMVQDIRAKQPTEIQNINGAIVAEGKNLGIATPVNSMLTEQILALQAKYSS